MLEARMAELAAKSCHRHTGLETYILGEDAVRRHGVAGPHFLKFKLFEEFPNAETILFFDADTIFLRAFDPALLAERPEWTCVCEPENSPWITEDAVRAGIATEEYFNSGFFIAHRRHHTGLLAEAERIAPGISSPFFEQTALNVARLRLGIAAHWLPAAYNRLDFANVLSVDGTVLAHVSGLGLWLPEEIRDYHRYWATRGNAPAEAARAAQSELSASAYEYDRIGHDFRRMTFLPGGLVADGAADAEKRWELADENGANVLWLTGHAQPTCYLLRDGRRGWRGRWIRQERMPVRLTVCGRLHPAEPKPVEVVLINRRRPRNIRFIVSALRVQREWCKVTLIDAAPTPDYATDEQTRDAVDRYVTIREHDGCNGFFLPLSRATAPFLYFHQDTALPGRYLLLAYLREMEAHPENGVLAQAGFTGGHFVRREILAEWWRLMLSNGEHDPMHLLETAARNAGFGAAVVRPRSPQESAGQQQLPQ